MIGKKEHITYSKEELAFKYDNEKVKKLKINKIR